MKQQCIEAIPTAWGLTLYINTQCAVIRPAVVIVLARIALAWLANHRPAEFQSLLEEFHA